MDFSIYEAKVRETTKPKFMIDALAKIIKLMFPFGAAVPRRGNPLKYFNFSFVKRASS